MSQISGLIKFALSTDAEVTGVIRSRWSMVTRFGNVVLNTFWVFFFGGSIVDMLRHQVPYAVLPLHANKELQNLWSSLMQSRLKKVESQSEPGCRCNAFNVFNCITVDLTAMWRPCVTAWSSPNPTRDAVIPLCSLLGSCWCQIPNQPEIAYQSLFKGHTSNLPKKAK